MAHLSTFDRVLFLRDERPHARREDELTSQGLVGFRPSAPLRGFIRVSGLVGCSHRDVVAAVDSCPVPLVQGADEDPPLVGLRQDGEALADACRGVRKVSKVRNVPLAQDLPELIRGHPRLRELLLEFDRSEYELEDGLRCALLAFFVAKFLEALALGVEERVVSPLIQRDVWIAITGHLVGPKHGLLFPARNPCEGCPNCRRLAHVPVRGACRDTPLDSLHHRVHGVLNTPPLEERLAVLHAVSQPSGDLRFDHTQVPLGLLPKVGDDLLGGDSGRLSHDVGSLGGRPRTCVQAILHAAQFTELRLIPCGVCLVGHLLSQPRSQSRLLSLAILVLKIPVAVLVLGHFDLL